MKFKMPTRFEMIPQDPHWLICAWFRLFLWSLRKIEGMEGFALYAYRSILDTGVFRENWRGSDVEDLRAKLAAAERDRAYWHDRYLGKAA